MKFLIDPIMQFSRWSCTAVTICLFLLSCAKIDLDTVETKCMRNKIKAFSRAKSTCDSGAGVSKYIFQNQVVYTFYQGNCGADFLSEVFNVDCELIGGVGGFGGVKIVNGEDFGNAMFVETIWSN